MIQIWAEAYMRLTVAHIVLQKWAEADLRLTCALKMQRKGLSPCLVHVTLNRECYVQVGWLQTTAQHLLPASSIYC